jgi:hypothetical protein
VRKINPVYKKYVKLPHVKLPNVKQKVIKLSDKTIEKKELATIFFSELGEFFLFLFNTFKETFSRDFEFKEFLRQCFQIGNKHAATHFGDRGSDRTGSDHTVKRRCWPSSVPCRCFPVW